MNFAYNRTPDFVNKFFNNYHYESIKSSKTILEVGIGSGMSLMQLTNTYLNKFFYGITLNDHVAKGYSTCKDKNYLRELYFKRFNKNLEKFPYVKYKSVNKKIKLKHRDYLFSIGCLGYQNINLINFYNNYIKYFNKFCLHIGTIDCKKSFINKILYTNTATNEVIFISENSADNSDLLDIVFTNTIPKSDICEDLYNIYNYKNHNNFKSFTAIIRIKIFIYFLNNKKFINTKYCSLISLSLNIIHRLYIDFFLKFKKFFFKN